MYKNVLVIVFNATFNNISVISWRSILLVEETGGSGENHWPAVSHWQTLSHNVHLNIHIISYLQAKGYFPPLSSPPFAALTRFPWLLGECLFLIGCRKWKWQPIRMSYKNMCFVNIKWAHVSFATRDCKHSHKKKQKTIWDTFSVFSQLRTYKCTCRLTWVEINVLHWLADITNKFHHMTLSEN
jgi:hypothetical protein